MHPMDRKILHITVSGKKATYHRRDGLLVCGNDDYVVEFAFDDPWWQEHNTQKVARFRWNGAHKDVPFYGNSCPVPRVTNARHLEVGVYEENGGLATTTPAVIPCDLSILCGSNVAQPEEIEKYKDIAVVSAERAETAALAAKVDASLAKEAADATRVYATTYHEMHGDILKSMYGSESGAILYVPDKGYAYNLESGVTGHNPETLRAMFFRDAQVYQINGHTFNGCSKLSYIDKFPRGLQDIHGSCFAYCGFSSIEIDCVNIQNRAFRNNPNLTKVVISDRVEQIYEFAFFECRKLDHVKIGRGVKSIGTGAFKNCMTDGSWQPVVFDMTAFTDGIAFPILADWDSFPSTAVIKVAKGRKEELSAMTNWSAWSYSIVEE